ncbi:MAG: hypothetical protein MUE68_02785 [Bacteroidetes bacterium]|jgi:hypothetical protein|nr:hypothetical protein [Bacteroidota bacterium]
MTRHVHVLFALVLLAAVGLGQGSRQLPQDTLAWVDGQPILARELRSRVELMPWPGPVRPSTIDSVKSHALSALIAERLLATEATREGLAMDRRYDLLRWGLTTVLLKDALFQREVAGRLRPTRKELEEGYRRYREDRTVLALLTRSRSAADSVASSYRRDRRSDGASVRGLILDRDTIAVSFGMTDTLLERMAYDIGPAGVATPRRMGEGQWMVLVLVDQRPRSSSLRQEADEQRRVAGQIVQQRLDGRAAESFFRSTLAERRARSESDAFDAFARLVSEVWLEDSSRYRRDAGYELTSDMVDVLHSRLREWNDRQLVSMDDGGLTVAQVVEMFRYETFVSPEPAGVRFQNRLNERVQSIVAGEYLARVARERSLEASPAVRSELRSWTEYWGAGEMLRAVRETVLVSRNDLVDELIRQRESLRGSASVLYEEVWATNRAEAAQIYSSVLQGEPFASLAAGRARRLPRIGPDGRSGWIDPTDDPVVGFHALLADSGAVVGPVAVDNGYVTIRVLGVRMSRPGIKGPELQRSLGPVARIRVANDRVNAYIADLAMRRQVRVEPDAVRRTAITTVPMFTRRYLGFGGSMNGAPMLLPLWEWVRQLPASANWPL